MQGLFNSPPLIMFTAFHSLSFLNRIGEIWRCWAGLEAMYSWHRGQASIEEDGPYGTAYQRHLRTFQCV